MADILRLGRFEKNRGPPPTMTTREELDSRRLNEAARIRLALNSMRTEAREKVKGGPGTVALASPILNIDVNRKAKVLRDPCTGWRLCVLACPTDAIIMIDR